MGRRAFTYLSVLSAAALSVAPALACDVVPVETARVSHVIDAVTYELSDGRILRLEGLGPPRAPAQAGRETNWPIMVRATAYAAAIVEGELVSFAATDAPDRYDRIIAQVYLDDGAWLNGVLAGGGFARVETLPDQRRCAGEGLALEAEARNEERGLWQLSAYAVRSSEESAGFTNDFQIVEGVVLDVADVRGRIFLNFGTDWRTDFTIMIAPGNARQFEGASYDLANLAGTRIRVRGWLEWYNGPMIEASHPEQVEVLFTE